MACKSQNASTQHLVHSLGPLLALAKKGSLTPDEVKVSGLRGRGGGMVTRMKGRMGWVCIKQVSAKCS